jgi:hypothetical protein
MNTKMKILTVGFAAALPAPGGVAPLRPRRRAGIAVAGTVLVAFFAACVFPASQAWAVTLGQQDDFQDGTLQNWVSSASPVNIATGGPSGVGDSYLQLTAIGGAGPGSVLGANNVTQWTGDYDLPVNSIIGILILLLNGGNSPLDMRIVLSKDGTHWTSTQAFGLPNDGQWHTATFSVLEADLTRVAGAATYDDTISDVTRLTIRHQSGAPAIDGTPVSATLGIDNVTAVPEPAALSLLALGGLGLLRRKRGHGG